jgi:hypothetical protein
MTDAVGGQEILGPAENGTRVIALDMTQGGEASLPPSDELEYFGAVVHSPDKSVTICIVHIDRDRRILVVDLCKRFAGLVEAGVAASGYKSVDFCEVLQERETFGVEPENAALSALFRRFWEVWGGGA